MAKKDNRDFTYYSNLVRTDPIAADLFFSLVVGVFIASGFLLKPAFDNRRNVKTMAQLEEKENDYEQI